MSDRANEDIERLMTLVERIRRAPRVANLARAQPASSVEKVATDAADGLLDIEKSATVLFSDLVPRLRALPPESPEFEDVLYDIAEEYRHIYYHITNSRLFNYVVPDVK